MGVVYGIAMVLLSGGSVAFCEGVSFMALDNEVSSLLRADSVLRAKVTCLIAKLKKYNFHLKNFTCGVQKNIKIFGFQLKNS